MLTDKIDTIIYNEVENIGKNDLIIKGVSTVIRSCTDDEEELHTNKLNNLLYFPNSHVKIISATALAESINYYEGTWVLTKRNYSIFNWDFGKYKKDNCSLRKLPFIIRYPRWIFQDSGIISISSTFKFSFASIFKRGYPITVKTMYFTPEAEDEVIRETVS